MKTVIALSLVLAVAAQAYGNGNSRPLFQVVIVTNPGLQYAVCGGSLIKQDKVLTGAQCCLGGTSFAVYLGTNNREDFELALNKGVRSKRSTIHERYNESSKVNDLCIIHLDEEARGQDITTIRLPSRSQVAVTLERQKAIVSGWKLTWKDKTTMKAKMMQAEVTIVQNDACKKIYPQFTTEMLCASNIYYGGFFGPLTIFESDGKETLIGLASYGPRPEWISRPAVYVKLTEYLDWIEKWTGVEIRP